MIYDELQKDKEIRDIEDRRRIEWMVLISIVFHALLIYMVFPEFSGIKKIATGPARKVVTVRRLRLPDRKQEQQKTKKKVTERKKLKPIPAPAPDEPETIEEFWEPEPEFDEDIPPDALVIFGDVEGPPAPDIDGPIRLSSDVIKPVLIRRVEPIYPDLARKANIEGIVILEAVISKVGRVTDARIIRSMGKSGLDEAAIDAVMQWEFTPATLNGIPVDVYMTLTVVFKLN